MERFDPQEGRTHGPINNVDEQTPEEAQTRTEEAAHTRTDNILTPASEGLAAGGVLPVAGAFGAATGAGIGAGMGTTGPLLPGAALYPVIAPLTEFAEADQGIAERAETALAEDGRLSAAVLQHVTVDVLSGRIVLSGTVPSTGEAEVAEKIAAQVTGARGVENQLTVGTV